MSKLIYDIMPPKKAIRKIERKTQKKAPFSGCYMRQMLVKIICLLLVIGLNWAGLSAIIGTKAYLQDIETSSENLFAAGALDFVLDSPDDFAPVLIAPGESTSREINFLNTDNLPKYKVRADEFTGELCDYLKLETSLDGIASVSSDLVGFVSNVVEFADPDVWSFKLTLPADAPETVQGKNCQFKFIFDGSQIKNNLDFGLGFNDTEEVVNNISAKICRYSEIKSMGYWKTHPSVYIPHLPQFLGAPGGDSIIGNQAQANQVFLDYNLSMRDGLNGQLLAMKFNIAHFGIGEYFVESQGKTLNQIVAEADDLLRNPSTPDSELEDMKNLLDYLNNLGQVKICNGGMGGEGFKIVINKVYYNVDSAHGEEGDNEWVELYNPTDEAIDISGWEICDNTSCDTFPIIDPIEADGFAIIASDSTTWDYWDIPEDVVKIELNSAIGNGLANNGDRVILKNALGIEIDAISYGTDKYAFDPACPDVNEGHMLGRYPNGFDTDKASDWQDFAVPFIQVDYPNGGEVWYVGKIYTLKWTATNPNGDNNELKIDLFYSNNSGETWGNIVKGTDNDGQFNWRVPLFIGGIGGYYVPSSHGRIKAVARGPENFMVSDWDMSDTDFCPPIDYELLTAEELAYLAGLIAPDTYFSPTETGNSSGGATEETQNIEEESNNSPEIIESVNDESATQEVTTETTSEEIITETTNEESVSEEQQVTIEENQTEENQEQVQTEEIQNNETIEPVIEEQPAIEQEPVIVPTNDNSTSDNAAPSGDGGGSSDAGLSSSDSEASSGDSAAASSDSSE